MYGYQTVTIVATTVVRNCLYSRILFFEVVELRNFKIPTRVVEEIELSNCMCKVVPRNRIHNRCAFENASC